LDLFWWMVSTSFFLVLRPFALPQSAWLIHLAFFVTAWLCPAPRIGPQRKELDSFPAGGKDVCGQEPQGTLGNLRELHKKHGKRMQKESMIIYGIFWASDPILLISWGCSLKHVHVDVPELLPRSGIHGKVCQGRDGSVQLGFS
jgi:hypothetical protein